MAYIGREIFAEYRKAKAKFKDFDTWEAEAVRDEFGVELQAPLMAAKICNTTRLPWENPEVFENIALVLNGREAIPDVDQDISIKEIAFAVRCLREEFPDEEFNDYICKYFAAEAGEEGIVVLPPDLKSGQRFIPPIFLTDEQQDIQKAYADEVTTYVKYMSDAAVISTMDTFEGEITEV